MHVFIGVGGIYIWLKTTNMVAENADAAEIAGTVDETETSAGAFADTSAAAFVAAETGAFADTSAAAFAVAETAAQSILGHVDRRNYFDEHDGAKAFAVVETVS